MHDPSEKTAFFHAEGAAYDVVAIAASAGGLQALTEVLSCLPVGFPAAILVVQHLDRHHPSLLVEILDRRTGLPVRQAFNGSPLEGGVIFVAPPDRHLLVGLDSKIELTRTELVHFVRPSADLLFESVAAMYKERCIAIVLTGTGVDGSMGVRAVKKKGGKVIAQDEETSEFFGMPSAAIQTGAVNFILPLKEIAPQLVALVRAQEGQQ